MAAGVYLYCIGEADRLTVDRVASLDARPADGSDARLRTLTRGSLAALVSDTEVRQFDVQRESLMAHQHVLEEAMKLGDILPVSYGTVAESEDAILERLLHSAADQLRENLEWVRGRVELSLRVMWNQERLFQEIVNEVDEIRAIRDAIAGLPEERTYYDRIRLGELTSNAVLHKSESEREYFLSRLMPLSADMQVNTSTSDMLILNASFLVDREREPDFDRAVQEIATPRQERMMFRYLGPLPPASFVSVMVEPES